MHEAAVRHDFWASGAHVASTTTAALRSWSAACDDGTFAASGSPGRH
ncbi:hypothetical protein AB0393_13900 [Streptomyces cyaneofuscatus]|nr:hypothetical protein [Streptomyces sp. VB1]UZI28154.1 hypothetical protein OH133_08415 [Streptomyces sp. VB1]